MMFNPTRPVPPPSTGKNIAFGLKRGDMTKKRIIAVRVEEMLKRWDAPSPNLPSAMPHQIFWWAAANVWTRSRVASRQSAESYCC